MATYKIIDNIGAELPLLNFMPESDFPGGAQNSSLARGYGETDVYIASRDFIRSPQPWQWKGQLVAANAGELQTKITQLLSFIKRTVRVVRAYDNGFIDLYGISYPMVVPTESKVKRDVTFAMMVKSLAWKVENTRAWGEGICGSGILPDGSGFYESI